MYAQYLFTVHDIGIYIYMKCSIIYTHIPSSKQLSLPRICSHIYSHISRNPLAIALFGLRWECWEGVLPAETGLCQRHRAMVNPIICFPDLDDWKIYLVWWKPWFPFFLINNQSIACRFSAKLLVLVRAVSWNVNLLEGHAVEAFVLDHVWSNLCPRVKLEHVKLQQIRFRTHYFMIFMSLQNWNLLGYDQF